MGVMQHDDEGDLGETESIPETVTFLATAHLCGALRLLPRLFTLIHRERRSAQGPVVLLDLGDTCAVSSMRIVFARAPRILLPSPRGRANTTLPFLSLQVHWSGREEGPPLLAVHRCKKELFSIALSTSLKTNFACRKEELTMPTFQPE